MIDLINLTTDDINILHDTDSDNCRVRFTALEGYEIIWSLKQATLLKAQILGNQEKLEKISVILNDFELDDNCFDGLPSKIRKIMGEKK